MTFQKGQITNFIFRAQTMKRALTRTLKQRDFWLTFGTGLLLFVIFFSLYTWFSAKIPTHNLFKTGVNFVELDTNRVINDMVHFSADHYRTKVHPIYVLLVNPIGSILGSLLKSPSDAARLLNCIFAALSVVESYVFFMIFSHNRVNSFLLSFMFGVTSGQIVFATFPETSTLAACSLIFTYTLFLWSLQKKIIHQPLWILAGVFSLGVTTTNFAQTAICYMIVFFSIQKGNMDWRKLFTITNFLGIVVIIAAILAVVQKMIYPSSTLFFTRAAYNEEGNYISPLVFQKPLLVLGELFRNLFIVNIVTPNPNLYPYNDYKNLYFTFQDSWHYDQIAWYSIILWGCIFLLGIYSIFQLKKQKAFYLGIGLCLLFNVILHAFYGVTEYNIEYFVYAGNFTFLTFSLISGLSLQNRWIVKLAVVTEIFFLLISNVFFVQKIADLYNTKEKSLFAYKVDLQILANNYGGSSSLPHSNYYLFGMGPREKMMYRDGNLVNLQTRKVIDSWTVADESIIPPEYRVDILTVNGEKVSILEDEEGVWIYESGIKRLISGGHVNLPTFQGMPYSSILRVLHQEILINIVDGKPLPNFLVYSEPWYRDAAIMCMVLEQTGNIGLVKDWILSLSDPYDFQAGINEPDNLGQALYMISLVSDTSHPLVPKILSEAKQIAIDGHLSGTTDGAQHPVYQTAWLKFGLQSLSLEDDYSIPNVSDAYTNLIWWLSNIRSEEMKPKLTSHNYPYLTWAEDHFLGSHNGKIGNQLYPLTWESYAGKADYSGMMFIDPIYYRTKTSVPHAWHSAEMFLLLNQGASSK